MPQYDQSSKIFPKGLEIRTCVHANVQVNYACAMCRENFRSRIFSLMVPIFRLVIHSVCYKNEEIDVCMEALIRGPFKLLQAKFLQT